MKVEGYLIKRINDLPQGSEIAPGLFNLYKTFLLNTLPNLQQDERILVFADNWVIGRDLRYGPLEPIFELINKNINETGKLEFEMSEATYLKFRQIRK